MGLEEEKRSIKNMYIISKLDKNPEKAIKHVLPSGNYKKNKLHAKILSIILGDTASFSDVCKMLEIGERKEQLSVMRYLRGQALKENKMKRNLDGLPRFHLKKERNRGASPKTFELDIDASLGILLIPELYPNLSKSISDSFWLWFKEQNLIKEKINEIYNLYNEAESFLKDKLQKRDIKENEYNKAIERMKKHKQGVSLITNNL